MVSKHKHLKMRLLEFIKGQAMHIVKTIHFLFEVSKLHKEYRKVECYYKQIITSEGIRKGISTRCLVTVQDYYRFV